MIFLNENLCVWIDVYIYLYEFIACEYIYILFLNDWYLIDELVKYLRKYLLLIIILSIIIKFFYVYYIFLIYKFILFYI